MFVNKRKTVIDLGTTSKKTIILTSNWSEFQKISYANYKSD